MKRCAHDASLDLTHPGLDPKTKRRRVEQSAPTDRPCPELPLEMWTIILGFAAAADGADDAAMRRLTQVHRDWSDMIQRLLTHVTLDLTQETWSSALMHRGIGKYTRLTSLRILLYDMNQWPKLGRHLTERIRVLRIQRCPSIRFGRSAGFPNLSGYSGLEELYAPSIIMYSGDVSLSLPQTLTVLETQFSTNYLAWFSAHLPLLHTLHVHVRTPIVSGIPSSVHTFAMTVLPYKRPDGPPHCERGFFIRRPPHFPPPPDALEEITFTNVTFSHDDSEVPYGIACTFPKVKRVTLHQCTFQNSAACEFFSAQFPNITSPLRMALAVGQA